jgi:small subunit ribosomal protein S14
MRRSMEKDKKKRIHFLKNEYHRKILKTISYNVNLPLALRLKAGLSLSMLPKNSSPTQIKKRCILTGRGRFILGPFNLSRLALRKLIRSGLVPGLRQSSW